MAVLANLLFFLNSIVCDAAGGAAGAGDSLQSIP